MNTRHLQPVRTSGLSVDSIDVAQLLRDLGEASAIASAVDLFGLCLRAQRVLACVHSGSAGGAPAPAEVVLLSTYRAMNPAGCDRLLSFARHLQKRLPRQQPALKLIDMGHAPHGACER